MRWLGSLKGSKGQHLTADIRDPLGQRPDGGVGISIGETWGLDGLYGGGALEDGSAGDVHSTGWLLFFVHEVGEFSQ